MKRKQFNPPQDKQAKLLILSDGKPGHENQAIAFARHLGAAYQVVPVAFRHRWGKLLSYLLDRIAVYVRLPFVVDVSGGSYAGVVSAGSGTYYATKVVARELGIPAIAIMLPKGYRYNFDLIVAQSHDRPPQLSQLVEVPINLSYLEPMGHVVAQGGKPYVAVIVGGDSALGRLSAELLKRQLEQLFKLFPGYGFWLSTSRRTSAEVEAVLRTFPFDWSLYYSERQINPLADFILASDYLFITADSTSMISEAVSGGNACVEVLPLDEGRQRRSKHATMVENLARMGCLHLFNGRIGGMNRKIHLSELLMNAGVAEMLGRCG